MKRRLNFLSLTSALLLLFVFAPTIFAQPASDDGRHYDQHRYQDGGAPTGRQRDVFALQQPVSVNWHIGDDFLEQATGVFGEATNVRQIDNQRVMSTGNFSNVPGRKVVGANGKTYKVW